MNHIDITVQALGGDVQLTRGMPSDLGLDNVSHHMVLPQATEEIILWIVGGLSADEKAHMIQGVLEYLDRTTRAINH